MLQTNIGRHMILPVADDIEADLKRRDAGFIVRLLLRLGMLLVVTVWAVNAIGDHQVGNCVADGFRAVTGEPPAR